MDHQIESDLKSLLKYIQQAQKEICRDNKCTEDEHNCGSYAYVNGDYRLLDICLPDYFQGSAKPYAAIPLPVADCLSAKELKDEIDEQLSE